MGYKEGTHYKLIAASGEVTIAYYYFNPDAREHGFGFNIADGGGFVAESDFVETTKVIELELKEV